MYIFKKAHSADYKRDEDNVNNGANNSDVRKVKLLAVLTKDSDNSRDSEKCFTEEAFLFLPDWS